MYPNNAIMMVISVIIIVMFMFIKPESGFKGNTEKKKQHKQKFLKFRSELSHIQNL